MHHWVHATAPLPDPVTGWDTWVLQMRDRPGVYKGLVKRACKLDSCRVAFVAALDGLHRGLLCQGHRLLGRPRSPECMSTCACPVRGLLPVRLLGQATPHGFMDTEARHSSLVRVVCAEAVANPSVLQAGSGVILPPCLLASATGGPLSPSRLLLVAKVHMFRPPLNLRMGRCSPCSTSNFLTSICPCCRILSS